MVESNAHLMKNRKPERLTYMFLPIEAEHIINGTSQKELS